MSSGLLQIAGGTVYDPAHGVDGQVRDIWIGGGKIVAAPTDPGSAGGARARRTGPGRHAGRRRHALSYRRPQDERRAKIAARRESHGRASAAHARTRSRHRRKRAQHVCHGLSLRRLGLYDGVRCGGNAAGGPARPPRTGRHALHRQGLLCPGRQQPLFARRDRPARARAGRSVSRLAAFGHQGLRPQAGQSRAASRPGSSGSTLHSLDDRVPGFNATPRKSFTTWPGPAAD